MVRGTEFAFAPAELRAQRGQTMAVAFRNEGTIPHTFTLPAADADTGSVGPGAEMTLNLIAPLEPGVYEFLCSFGGHLEAGMVGSHVVEA